MGFPQPKTLSQSWRRIGHMGTETRPQLVRGSSVESWAMEATLTQLESVAEKD